MLRFLGPRATDRKLRLFLCACCYSVWDGLPEWCRKAVEVGEQYADGLANKHVRLLAARQTREVSMAATAPVLGPRPLARQCSWIANQVLAARITLRHGCLLPQPERVVERLQSAGTIVDEGSGLEAVPSGGVHLHVLDGWYADLLRDIVGNPFRVVPFDPAWLTPTATALARQLYETRSFASMPILADALQDAGCENDDILDHCRHEHSPHARGCWVVDAVLGKE
jgi:hypothetical protein